MTLTPGLFRQLYSAVIVFILATSVTAQTVSTPAVSNAPVGTYGFPFLSSAEDLTVYGYVEEEFLMAGNAKAYLPDEDLTFNLNGQWNVHPNPDASSAYQVRLLVRRPINPADFNGTVLVEWINVTPGLETTPDWYYARAELLRRGYAYVGVSAQYIGVEALKSWDPARYGDLLHPGDSFSYAIYSQTAKAISQPAAGDPQPLGALTAAISQLLATGQSQSAQRLHTYYNSVHALDNVYDGFLIHSAFDTAAISQSSAAEDVADFFGDPIPAPDGVPATPDESAPNGTAATIRTDLGTPVMYVQTESDVEGLITLLSLGVQGVHWQDDSAVLRVWELAGTAHADSFVLDAGADDLLKSGATSDFDLECGDPAINPGEVHSYAMRAAVNALNHWVGSDIAPSSGARFTIIGGHILRNSHANATSGIKLPQLSVPIATLTGKRALASTITNFNCLLFGAMDNWKGWDDWDGNILLDPLLWEPSLFFKYWSHRNYVSKVRSATNSAVNQGFLMPEDAIEIINTADAANVP